MSDYKIVGSMKNSTNASIAYVSRLMKQDGTIVATGDINVLPPGETVQSLRLREREHAEEYDQIELIPEGQ